MSGLAEELLCIGWFHAAAVLNSDLAGSAVVREFLKHCAHVGVSVLRLGGSCRLSCSNRPNWFIGDHGFKELVGANSGECAAKLFLQNLLLSASLPLLERFSDAENRL